MPTTTTKAQKSTTSKAPAKTATKSAAKSAGGTDAIALLTEDHRKVQKMFKDYEKLAESEAADEERQALANRICTELTIHAQIEEELFYPAVRDAADEERLIDEATVEHASAKELIAQIESMQPDEALYDAKVVVLGEYINHHVKEEQDEIFPMARKKIDTAALGERMKSRKQDLMTEMGAMDEDGADDEEDDEA